MIDTWPSGRKRCLSDLKSDLTQSVMNPIVGHNDS